MTGQFLTRNRYTLPHPILLSRSDAPVALDALGDKILKVTGLCEILYGGQWIPTIDSQSQHLDISSARLVSLAPDSLEAQVTWEILMGRANDQIAGRGLELYRVINIKRPALSFYVRAHGEAQAAIAGYMIATGDMRPRVAGLAKPTAEGYHAGGYLVRRSDTIRLNNYIPNILGAHDSEFDIFDTEEKIKL